MNNKIHINILAIQNQSPMSVVGIYEVLKIANNKYKTIYGNTNDIFFPKIVGKSYKVKAAFEYPIYCHTTIDKVTRTDVVIIPSLHEVDISVLKSDYIILKWLETFDKTNSLICSINSGAFLLGLSGLLDRTTIAIQEKYRTKFLNMFPTTSVIHEVSLLDSGRVISSAKGMSYLNMLLYIIEMFCGIETAILTSKEFLKEDNTLASTNFVKFNSLKFHNDSLVLKAQLYIESHYLQNLNVSDVARDIGMSSRNLNRRFKKITKHTVKKYITLVKIEAAKKMIRKGGSINQIAYSLGYESPDYFSKLFKTIQKETPSSFKRSNNQH